VSRGLAARWPALAVGLLLVLGAALLYLASNPERLNFYNHFVWQADAFLHGETSFAYPVEAGPDGPGNSWFQDVYPLRDGSGRLTGRVLIPFPPLPAVVLLPFVALFGLRTDQELVSIVLAALDVGLVWWVLGRLPIRAPTRTLVTVFVGAGTVLWWTAAVGTTWYLAHLVALAPSLAAVGIALGSDPGALAEADRGPADGDGPGAGEGDSSARASTGAAAGEAGDVPAAADASRDGDVPAAGWRRRLAEVREETFPLDRRQLLAGFLLGLAATARLSVVFGAPFLVLVGSGGTWRRRMVSAGVGAAVPVAALLLYTFVTTGAFIHPGYDYQYRLEALGYPTLGYHPEWDVEDVRYIPQNLGIMLGSAPAILPEALPNTLGYTPDVPVCTGPGATRGLFDLGCPLAVPRDVGTSIVLTSPAFVLALLPLRRPRRRLVAGAALAVSIIALFNLAHFSQGWVQWGYRFSNDFLPFLLPLVALGVSRPDGRPRRLAIALVGASVVINAWGVAWARILGW
jgi:hypothetical protein